MSGTHRSGRNPKTVAAHRRDGTYQPVRHAGRVNPELPFEAPPKPDGLNEDAAAQWDRLVSAFERMGLTSVDGDALAKYCRLHAMIERLSRTVDALPSLVFDKTSVDGAGVEHCEPKIHPAVGQLRSAIVAARPFLVEFGLTPASRARVQLPGAGASREPSALEQIHAMRQGLSVVPKVG